MSMNDRDNGEGLKILIIDQRDLLKGGKQLKIEFVELAHLPHWITHDLLVKIDMLIIIECDWIGNRAVQFKVLKSPKEGPEGTYGPHSFNSPICPTGLTERIAWAIMQAQQARP